MKLFKNHIKNSKNSIGNGPRFRILLNTPRFILHFSTFESNQRIIPFDQPNAILQENNTKKSDKHPLISKLESYINTNLNNEQFGVEQLAEMMGMSRSHLHRQLHKVKGKSISRFIREYRLKAAREMLIEKEMTASEVSHAVGFGSPSYFNKCFTEYFGYSPGKARLKVGQEIVRKPESGFSKNQTLLWLGGLAAAVLIGFLVFSGDKKEVVASEATIKEKSIIVLPFKNLSSDEENQYLADGMVDAISRHLTTINDLKVISSDASKGFSSLKKIGKALGVANIVKGNLQRQDSTIRIEIKLYETTSGTLIWAESYDRKILDVLDIQSDVAEKVANTLRAKMSPEEQQIITKRTSYDPKAYDNYLKGMFNMNHIGDLGMDRALLYFEKAIAIDSSIAPAYASIANYYQMKASIFSATIDGKEAQTNAEHYLDLALKLDEDWHFNFSTKAFQLTFFHWNFEEADKNHSVGLKAKKPLNYFMYRDFLQFENRHEEALEISRIIDTERPFYPNSPLIMPYYYNGMLDEGEAYIALRLESFPNNYLTLDNAGFFYLNTGHYDKAIHIFLQLIELKNKRFPRILGWMGAAHARKGETRKARSLLNELKELKSRTDAGAPEWFVAIIHSALGEKKDAIKWIEIAINDHEMEIPWLVSEPQFYPLHGMPEFDALVKRVGFREHAYPVELPEKLY